MKLLPLTLLFCWCIMGNAQEIVLHHPERNLRKNIVVNSYVIFEYEFINAEKISKWGVVKGKILQIENEQFLLEQGGQQTWFEVSKLWAIKRVSRGAYRRFARSGARSGMEDGAPWAASAAEAVGMIATSLVWSSAVVATDLLQHSSRFRYSQSKGWEFGVE